MGRHEAQGSRGRRLNRVRPVYSRGWMTRRDANEQVVAGMYEEGRSVPDNCAALRQPIGSAPDRTKAAERVMSDGKAAVECARRHTSCGSREAHEEEK